MTTVSRARVPWPPRPAELESTAEPATGDRSGPVRPPSLPASRVRLATVAARYSRNFVLVRPMYLA